MHIAHVDEVAKMAGSLWELHPNSGFRSFVKAKLAAEMQTAVDVEELQACLRRSTTPLGKLWLWRQLELTQVASDVYTGLPNGLLRLPLLSDRLQTPELVLVGGLDYRVIDDVVEFRPNILEGDVTLWGHFVLTDERWLDDLWGSVLGLTHPSTEAYRQLLNLLYEHLLTNTDNSQACRDLLSLLPDINQPRVHELLERG